MYDYMKQFAARNVWCSPEEDNQTILVAKRITKPNGERIEFTCMERRIALPNKNKFYHIFQVGQLPPKLLGLMKDSIDQTSVQVWQRFDEAMTELPLFVDLYSDKGVQVPLHLSYYMFTKDRALIFAFDGSSCKYIDFTSEQIYARFYTNVFYENAINHDDGNTYTGGVYANNTQDILDIQYQIQSFRELSGEVFCYRNGLLVHDISAATATVGDILEYKCDTSVRRVLEFKLSSLRTFLSTLDQQRKYILHPPTNSGEIDYLDDVDIYIVKKTGAAYTGQYLHRNQVSTVRMLTHQDYSVSVSVFETIAQSLASKLSSDPIDLREFYFRVYVRDTGVTRPLVEENQRIFELYKLSNARIIEAMTGVSSNVSVWKAANLEASAYCELMRCDFKDINIDLIQRAFGYNGITKVVGDSPILIEEPPVDRLAYTTIPVAYQEACSVYEYDSDGYLSRIENLESRVLYTSSSGGLLEFVVGNGSWNAPAEVGSDLLSIPSDDSYRVYQCYLDNDGHPNNNWTDITGSDKYTVSNGKLHWVSQETQQWLMVRTDKSFLAYTLELTPIAGTIYFDLTEFINGDLMLMQVPMDDLTIWLNNRRLIKNLDYFVVFPRVHIVAKEYFAQPALTTPQVIDVRYTGLASSLMKDREAEDYGFIEHGFLSNNGRFNIRDDKLLSISVRGKTLHRSTLEFSEEHTGVSITNILNGSPYQIKECILPLRENAEAETYQLREASLVIDKEIENYLTLKLPQPPRDSIYAIPQRYLLVSPFFSHIITDLHTGQFNNSDIDKVLSDNEVLELCKPYEPLLKFDPINPENEIDSRFVVIHPTATWTPLALSLQAYRFVQQVVKLYGRGLISLSPHLTVSLGG